jgi:hypothetical protein
VNSEAFTVRLLLLSLVPDEEGVTAAQIDRGRAKPNGKGLLHVVMVGEW